MKFYLSSYKLGDKTDKLKELAKGVIGFIPNAMDFIPREEIQESHDRDIQRLRNLGIEVEMLDLREYFGKKDSLAERLKSLSGVFVRGGYTYVCRAAMRLSGFDDLIKEMPDSFLYSGYSAGVCVLAPSISGLNEMDDPSKSPYPSIREPISEGLGLIDYLIIPHYKSDHPETELADKDVEYCKSHNINYKTLRDGEVIIIE